MYLTGPWPQTITLNALSGDSTVIIIVNEYGVQTTINANGTTTVSTYSGSGTGGSDTGGSGYGSGSGSGDNSGGEDGGSGDEGYTD